MKTSSIPYGIEYGVPNDYENFDFKNDIRDFFVKNTWILAALTFFISRASQTTIAIPLAVSIYAAAFGFEVNRFVVIVSMIIGMLSVGQTTSILSTIISIIILHIADLFIERKGKHRKNLKLAASAFGATFIPKFASLFLRDFLIYDFFKVVIVSATVFSLVFVFRYSLNILFGNLNEKTITSSQIISLAATGILFITGFSGVNIFGISLKSFLCVLLILVFSCRYGAGIGASIGVVVGLVYGVSGEELPMMIGVYAFCGLLSGFFKNLGKLGTALGFVMGNAIFALCFNGTGYVLIHIKEIILAIPFFLLIPDKAIDFTAKFLNENHDMPDQKNEYLSCVKDIAVEKLNMFSKAFEELALTFGEISETKFIADKQDLSSFFDKVADKVCKGCIVSSHCWDRNFFDTYQVMYKMLEKLEAKGFVDREDIPEDFYARCGRVRDFIDAINNIYEIFKVDMIWKSKIGENRSIVSQQFGGLSKVILKLAQDINTNICVLNELSFALKKELIGANIRVKEVTVYKNKNNKYEVRISYSECNGNMSCEDKMCAIASNMVNIKMVKKETTFSINYTEDICVLELVEQENISITCGISRISKSSVKMSGDNYTFMNGGDGKYFIALSDGMGTGQRAHIYSKATIDLLEKFIETGFDKDEAIKLINSALVLKSGGDSFATIDLSVIDLYDGEVEFIKIGAAPTFVKRRVGVEIVKAASLPAGILSNLNMELIRKKVKTGDYIIMMTDGVFDCFNKKEGKVKAFTEFINNIDSSNPQEISDIILNQAYENIGCKPVDDMMVLVAKVWQRLYV